MRLTFVSATSGPARKHFAVGLISGRSVSFVIARSTLNFLSWKFAVFENSKMSGVIATF